MSLQLYPVPAEDIEKSRYKGKNAKRLLVVLPEMDIRKYFELLSKILRAVSFDIDSDAHLLTLEQDESIALFSSPALSDYDRIMALGVPTKSLGLSLDLQGGVQRLETVSVIVGPSLDRISGDDKVKRAFWSILKSEFTV